jgi:hypothetical protein
MTFFTTFEKVTGGGAKSYGTSIAIHSFFYLTGGDALISILVRIIYWYNLYV